jgi:hypothetical protein
LEAKELTNNAPRWRHTSLFYRDRLEQALETIAFISEGLDSQERCIYVTADPTTEWWRGELQSSGLDVVRETKKGSLRLWTKEQWRPQGKFNSLRMARRAWEIVEESLSKFRGLRLAVDMGWSLQPPLASDAVCHWEATLDYLLSPDLPVTVMCQYDMHRLPGDFLHAGLRTHPALVSGTRLVGNPHYAAPAILEHEPDLNGSTADPEAVKRMLAELFRVD